MAAVIVKRDSGPAGSEATIRVKAAPVGIVSAQGRLVFCPVPAVTANVEAVCVLE